ERAPMDEVISHPHGMVLMVGPTGSGKTTTLYSILQKLNTTERKIITLEDPVEYALDGMSQIPVYTREGDSFAAKLRAVLRLDPDVVMVGEIRDVDTARTALQASITGHLVLSTFHAGSAAEAFTRIIDMIGKNPILVSAIKLIISQRLVRRLDDATKQEYEPDENLKNHIKDVLKDLPEGVEK
ncbi:Flp pilus assembly complex ATPase component TadA, partial [Candidatus Saccharibacteria bacterium]|nr:Flp pilus assembly complex ATPase component TadA [Candidatus Saccharibacteria bacterium]